MIVSFHATHASAGAEGIADVISKLGPDADGFVGSLSSVTEYVILRTCNRFEIYAASTNDAATDEAFRRFGTEKVPYAKDDGIWYILRDIASVRHLFRVTCGLDSMIIGEDQIQGQVRDAYNAARAEGHVGKAMERLFERALHIGKRVRSETELNSGAISVGSAAVELAEEEIGGLRGKTVAVIGAGDMATVVAKNLRSRSPNAIVVSNRTYEHARELAGQLNGVAVNFDKVAEAMGGSNLVIVATSAPHVLIDRAMAERAMIGRSQELLIIDISVPRNVADDVSSVPGVKVDSMEGIKAVSSRNLMKRRMEIVGAEAIVREELAVLECERGENAANEVIGCIAKRNSQICDEELSVAVSRIQNGADPEETMQDLSRALVAKIMAEPYEKLRTASRGGRSDVCEAANILFGVEKK
jgi:glutamyl-tRNA reductase